MYWSTALLLEASAWENALKVARSVNHRISELGAAMMRGPEFPAADPALETLAYPALSAGAGAFFKFTMPTVTQSHQITPLPLSTSSLRVEDLLRSTLTKPV